MEPASVGMRHGRKYHAGGGAENAAAQRGHSRIAYSIELRRKDGVTCALRAGKRWRNLFDIGQRPAPVHRFTPRLAEKGQRGVDTGWKSLHQQGAYVDPVCGLLGEGG